MLDKYFPTYNKFNKVFMKYCKNKATAGCQQNNYFFTQPKPPTQLEKKTATA